MNQPTRYETIRKAFEVWNNQNLIIMCGKKSDNIQFVKPNQLSEFNLNSPTDDYIAYPTRIHTKIIPQPQRLKLLLAPEKFDELDQIKEYFKNYPIYVGYGYVSSSYGMTIIISGAEYVEYERYIKQYPGHADTEIQIIKPLPDIAYYITPAIMKCVNAIKDQ